MMINELLSDEKFLDLLDKDNSEDLLKYISNLRFKKELTQNNLCEIGKMFKELGIYSDICLDKANFAENKKYIGPGVFNRIKNQCLDLRNKVLASASVVIPSECVLIIDNTTKVLINDFLSRAALYIDPSIENTIILESIPRENLFAFDCQYSKVNVKFKIKDNISDFMDFVKNQEWLYYSSPIDRIKIIDKIIQNVERA